MRPRYWDSALLALAAVGMLLVIHRIVLVTPVAQKEAGYVAQKIFYFHVCSAWTSFLAFFVAAIAAVGSLRTSRPGWDHTVESAIETGMVFCTLVVMTGPIWAKPVWGTYWRAEPRLLSFMVMWFAYAGFLVLRQALATSSRRAQISAVYAIIASINVPLVYFSVRMIDKSRQLHPRRIGLAPAMRQTLYQTLAVFTLLWLVLLILRYRIAVLQAAQAGRRLARRMEGLDG